MKYLMIHHVAPSVLITLKHFLPDYYTFIFDDGLYSLYYYRESLLKLPNRKILAITPSLIASEDIVSKQINLEDNNAMGKAFLGDKSGYLTLNQILELSSTGKYPCEICYHGYDHDVILHGLSNGEHVSDWRYYNYHQITEDIKKYFNINSCLSHPGYKINNNNKFVKNSQKEYLVRIETQISNMREFFSKYLPDRTNLFIPPFNSTSRELLDILAKFDILEVIGQERIDICNYVKDYYSIFSLNKSVIDNKLWSMVLSSSKKKKLILDAEEIDNSTSVDKGQADNIHKVTNDKNKDILKSYNINNEVDMMNYILMTKTCPIDESYNLQAYFK